MEEHFRGGLLSSKNHSEHTTRIIPHKHPTEKETTQRTDLLLKALRLYFAHFPQLALITLPMNAT